MLSSDTETVLAESEESLQEPVMKGAEASADYKLHQNARKLKVMTLLKWDSAATI